MSAHNDKLVFIHLPKTGGSWAFEAMKAAGVPLERLHRPVSSSLTEIYHPRAEDIRINGRFPFAFVRKPLSWYGSAYNYRRKMRWNDESFPGDPWLDLDFPDFLEKMIEHYPNYLTRVYSSFLDFPEDRVWVGHYESLQGHLIRALEMAGQPFNESVIRSYPPINRSEPLPDCPESVKWALIASESEVLERYY